MFIHKNKRGLFGVTGVIGGFSYGGIEFFYGKASDM